MKKRNNLTRKQKAMRSISCLIALMLIANTVFHTGYLFPVQVLRESEERLGCGQTSVIQWWREPHATDAPFGMYTVFFAENENVTWIAGVGFSFLRGWEADARTALDCSREAPFYVGKFWKSCRDRNLVCCLFGRVDDPKIQRITIGDEKNMLAIDREAFIEQDGRLYFLLRKEGELPPVKGRYEKAYAWDKNGTLLMEISVA